MRAPLKYLCSILLFLFIQMQSFGQNLPISGLELSDSISSFLRKNGYTPYNQSLVTSGENTFPYNVSITIKAKNPSETKENLILIFAQDDVIDRQDMIKNLLSKLSKSEYDFDITVLFAYGEKQKIEKQDMIFGTQVYIDSITSNLGYTAIIFNLESEKYNIETSASGTCSPPWLIQNASNSLIEASKGRELPLFYLSQVSNYKFFYNRILSAFFNSEIPAIIINMQKDDSQEEIILSNVERFSKTKNRSWEHHFLVIRLFGRYRLISELLILKIIIPTIFIWIVYIFILFFVNTRMKKHAWSTIKSIWYIIPVTYGLLIAGFFIGRFLSTEVFSFTTDSGKIYGQFSTQILLSLFIAEFTYICILFLNYKFVEYSIDYILIICCFINQSFFIIADISLCPIFITICLFSLLAFTIKDDILHIIIFVLMILPFIPYGNDVILASDTRLLQQFISSSKLMNFILPLALYPIFIIIFRNLTSIRSRTKKMSRVIFMALGFFSVVAIFLITLGIIRTKQINSRQILPPVITLSPEGEELIDISYDDEHIFDDIVRTLNIKFNEKCIICDVQITTKRRNPILYTDNDYISITDKSIRFSIPDYPPQKMTFSYGAAPVPCRIMVSAVLPPLEGSEYRFITKNIKIGDME